MMFPGATNEVPPGILYQNSSCIANNSLNEQDMGLASLDAKGIIYLFIA